MQGTRTFWDTSAIVPTLVFQNSSKSANTLLRKHKKLVLAWITRIEIYSAPSRLARQGVLNNKNYTIAVERFNWIEKNRIEVFPSETLRALSIDLLQQYELRAADAMQLASALIWCNEKPNNKPFITFDEQLALAASKAGFAVHSM